MARIAEAVDVFTVLTMTAQ